MKTVPDLLTIRIGGARARFLDDLVRTLRETAPAQPSRIDLERELREQIGHGQRILEMAHGACGDLASYVKLEPEVHKALTGALVATARLFRSLQRMLSEWMQRNHEAVSGCEELTPLIRRLDDSRAELIAAWHDVFPGLELDKVTQAIQDLDAGNERRLEAILTELSS